MREEPFAVPEEISKISNDPSEIESALDAIKSANRVYYQESSNLESNEISEEPSFPDSEQPTYVSEEKMDIKDKFIDYVQTLSSEASDEKLEKEVKKFYKLSKKKPTCSKEDILTYFGKKILNAKRLTDEVGYLSH